MVATMVPLIPLYARVPFETLMGPVDLEASEQVFLSGVYPGWRPLWLI